MSNEVERELEFVRNIALSLKRQLDEAREETKRIVWAMVISAGGEVEVDYRLLVVEGGRLSREEDVEGKCIVLRADMGIGEDQTKQAIRRSK